MFCLYFKCERGLKKTEMTGTNIHARGKAGSILLLLFEYSQLVINTIHFSQNEHKTKVHDL